jgi:hypothetical protein
LASLEEDPSPKSQVRVDIDPSGSLLLLESKEHVRSEQLELKAAVGA